ncbi:MAG: iron ABC transporter permease [Pseudomonadota bacterium]
MTVSRVVNKTLFYVSLAFLAWLVITFLYYPITAVLFEAFGASGTPLSETVDRLLGSENVRESVFNTIFMACLTVVTVNVIGLFQVAILEFFSVRGSGFLKVAFATPIVFTSVTAITGYVFVYGEFGTLTKFLTLFAPEMETKWFAGWPAVLIAHSFLMTYYHFLFVRAAIRRVDFATVEAARSLGASPTYALIKVVFPVMAPTVLAVSLLVFLQALVSFAAPAILGGREFRMLSQMILSLQSIGRSDMAALLALVLGFAALLVFLGMRWIESRGAYTGGSKTPVPMQKIRIRNPVTNGIVHVLAYALFVIYLVPVLSTVIFSFAPSASIATELFPTTFTLDNYIAVLTTERTFNPIANSVTMGLITVISVLCICVFSTHLIARNRNFVSNTLEFSLFIPWVLPGALVAVSLISAFDLPSPLLFGNVLLGTYAILPIAYAIIIIPVTVRLLTAAMANLDPSLEDAGKSLGASGLYIFYRITLPILAPVLVLIGAMKFTDILNEYTASAFLYNVNNMPLGVAMVDNFRSSTDPEADGKALVFSTIVMTLSFCVVMVAERLSLGRTEEAPT